MKKAIKQELGKLQRLKQVDKDILKKAVARIDNDPKIVKKNNVESHFCSFFVPIDKKTNNIFLGHHIKADDWIPPGGHIELNEHPKNTVIREYKEELNHELKNEVIELFDITITDVSTNPRNPCKVHYDLWYVVYVEKKDYEYDKGEYYDAGWFDFNEALSKIKTKHYNATVKKLIQNIASKTPQE